MTTTTFDTPRFVKRLADAGVDRKHAEAIAEGLREELAGSNKDVATKLDIQILETKIEAKAAELFRNMIMVQVAVGGLIVAMIKLLP